MPENKEKFFDEVASPLRLAKTLCFSLGIHKTLEKKKLAEEIAWRRVQSGHSKQGRREVAIEIAKKNIPQPKTVGVDPSMKYAPDSKKRKLKTSI